MTDATLVILVSAIPPTIASITAAIVSLASLRKVKETGFKTDAVLEKSAVIEGHVNSAATRNAEVIAAQQTQLQMLREQVSDFKQTAMVLAQTKGGRRESDAQVPPVERRGVVVVPDPKITEKEKPE